MQPFPWTGVLLACTCAAIGAGAISAYDKKYQMLSAISKQDNLWKHLFQENVYYKLNRMYYRDIIENELLRNASPTADDGQTAADDGETVANHETQDLVMPYEFVRNILVNRFVIGSILDMALSVLVTSFKCLMYKHVVHLITLIRVQIMRKKSQTKATSWSGKSKVVTESILMTMGALQFTDEHLLAVLSFFDKYKASNGILNSRKFDYTTWLKNTSNSMLEYVQHNCVRKPKTEQEVAVELGVYVVKSLFSTGASFEITDTDFKKMIESSRELIQQVFGLSPRIDGMPVDAWYGILHYQENLKLKS